MAKRRSAKQLAATARLVAANAARRVGTIIAPARAVVRRAASRVRTVYERAAPRGTVRRRVASALGRGGSVVAIGTARILPATAGGYAIGLLERYQRVAHAKGIGGTSKKSGAVIENPTYRLGAELLALALVGSRTEGMLREAACGAAGAVGFAYELYANTDGTNPDDSYLEKIKAGQDGL